MSDKPHSKNESQAKLKKPLPKWLFVLPFLMFGFGYAMVPIYEVICDITGLNGKTGRWQQEQAASVTANKDRKIKIEFIASVNRSAAFDFKPVKNSMWVNPGKPYEMEYIARNLRNNEVVAQGVPSVTPGKAAAYFNKTECFCFVQQPFKGNEEKNMPLVFIVDPAIPESVNTITLSYTFFDAGDQVTAN